MNKWMELYSKKKLFIIGDIVFWDRLILTGKQIHDLVEGFGHGHFEVLSLPYESRSFDGEWVNIGRMEIYVTRANPLHLIRIIP